MSYPVKEILRNFLSVVAGVIVALMIILPSGILAGLLSFSDAAIPKLQEFLSIFLWIAGIVAGCLPGGYTTVKISTRKDLIHAFITGIVLTFLYALIHDFEFNWLSIDTGITYFVFIPAVMIGGIMGIRKKRIISNNHSFPSDIP